MIFGLTGAGMAGSVPGGAGGALWAGRAVLAIYGKPVAMEMLLSSKKGSGRALENNKAGKQNKQSRCQRRGRGAR